MDKCKGFFGWARCNFEARYDEIAGDVEIVRALAAIPNVGNVSVPSMNRYVCDVCTACGETRQRPPK